MQYTLMNKNTPVLKCKLSELGEIIEVSEIMNPEYMPIGVAKNEELRLRTLIRWWHNRTIPASREGIDDILDELGLSSTSELAKNSLGLSLSDQYWINPEGKLKWHDVNFFNNDFSDDMGDLLLGAQSLSGNIDMLSPDNTSEGMLRKRWKIVDGTRCLIKGSSTPFYQEPYNEKFASALLKIMGIDHNVKYEVIDGKTPYSICDCFIDENTELVTARQIKMAYTNESGVSDYEHILTNSAKLGINGMKEHLDQILTLDYLIVNNDRHTRNFGAVRNIETLEWEGVAPIYDNGNSMWYNILDTNISNDHVPSKPFEAVHEKQISLVSSFDWLNINHLHDLDKMLSSIYEQSSYMSNERIEIISSKFAERAKKLELIMS